MNIFTSMIVSGQGSDGPGSAVRISRSNRRSIAALFGLAVGLAVGLSAATAGAADLVYTPVNPNFGGNPFNDGILLGTANAQNKFEEDRDELDPTERFVQSLQSRLFSGLARQVTDAIFGDDPQESGTFTVGDQQVSFERGVEFITLEIANLADGSSTVIEVPAFEVDE